MEVVQCFTGCLKHIKYIPKILLRMSKAQATIGDWIALYKTLYHAVYIGDIAKAQPGNIEIFRKIKHAFTEDLHKCVNLISKTIDFEESKIKKRFVVLPHIDKTLDEKKLMFNGLPDLMSEVARQEIEGLSSDIRECVVSYLPEIGYLLVIEMPEGKTVHDDHTIEGLDFMFSSDNQLFYKSPRTLELDDLLGDTQLEICDIEVKTMHRLQSTILESTSVMLKIMELSAELDCLMALAICAKEFDYIQPKLVEENIIDVKAGRHPLQELCCHVFVPNDISMGGNNSKMKLITGPNACGKSVYLKQVALIVYMAHIGSFVPAQEANIGPCDGIFTRLKSIESVTLNMSTFMQDLSQVSLALNTSSASSLIILDEFGKGTESTDGLSLLTAVMKYWMGKESDCPLTLISTHFHNMIHQRLLPKSSNIEYLTFDTLTNEDELVYLYQLIPGHTSSSYACKCAAQVGIPSEVTQRGQQVSDLLCQNRIVPLEDTESSLKQRRMHERIADKFLDLNLRVDDVKSFLKDFVLKEFENQKKESKSTPLNGHNQAEKRALPVSKSATESVHLKKIKTSTESTKSNEERMGLDQKQNFNGNTKKQTADDTKPLQRKKDPTTSVPTSAKKHLFKPGQHPLVDLTKEDDALCGDKGVLCVQTRQDFVFTTPIIADVKNRNSGNRLHSGSLNNTDFKSFIPHSSQKDTQTKPSFQASHSNTLYATPVSLRLMNETYHKSLNFGTSLLASRKRKDENLELTDTQLKLFNPPTPCLSYRDKTSSVSAVWTKKSSTTNSIQYSSTTTDNDAPKAKLNNTVTDLNQINSIPQLSPICTSDDLDSKVKESIISAPLTKMSSIFNSRQYTSTTTDTDAPKAKRYNTGMLSNKMNSLPQLSPIYTSDDPDVKAKKSAPLLKISSTLNSRECTTDKVDANRKQSHNVMHLNEMNSLSQLSPIYTSSDLDHKVRNSSFSIAMTVNSRPYSTSSTDTDAQEIRERGKGIMILNQINSKPQFSPVYTTDQTDKKAQSTTDISTILSKRSCPVNSKHDNYNNMATSDTTIVAKSDQSCRETFLNLNHINPKLQFSPLCTSDDLDDDDKARNSTVLAPLSKRYSTTSSRHDSDSTMDTDAAWRKQNHGVNPKPPLTPIYSSDEMNYNKRNFKLPTPVLSYPDRTSSVTYPSTKMPSTVNSRPYTTDTDSPGMKQKRTEMIFDRLNRKPRRSPIYTSDELEDDIAKKAKKSPLYYDSKTCTKPPLKVSSDNSDTSSKSGDHGRNPSSLRVVVSDVTPGGHQARHNDSSTEYPLTSC